MQPFFDQSYYLKIKYPYKLLIIVEHESIRNHYVTFISYRSIKKGPYYYLLTVIGNIDLKK